MKIAIALFTLVAIVGLSIYLLACPCGPVPGAWLFGDEATQPVEDWSFVNDKNVVPLCQLQVSTWRPHSINLNCMANAGSLYVSCSNCADKGWSQSALEYPQARIRIGQTIYPVNLRRVANPNELDMAWSARLSKLQREVSPRPDHWWSFQLSSR